MTTHTPKTKVLDALAERILTTERHRRQNSVATVEYLVREATSRRNALIEGYLTVLFDGDRLGVLYADEAVRTLLHELGDEDLALAQSSGAATATFRRLVNAEARATKRQVLARYGREREEARARYDEADAQRRIEDPFAGLEGDLYRHNAHSFR